MRNRIFLIVMYGVIFSYPTAFYLLSKQSYSLILTAVYAIFFSFGFGLLPIALGILIAIMKRNSEDAGMQTVKWTMLILVALISFVQITTQNQ